MFDVYANTFIIVHIFISVKMIRNIPNAKYIALFAPTRPKDA